MTRNFLLGDVYTKSFRMVNRAFRTNQQMRGVMGDRRWDPINKVLVHKELLHAELRSSFIYGKPDAK